MSRLFVELPVHTIYYTYGFYDCILYLALGQGLGTKLSCRIPDIVSHHIEKTKKNTVLYCTVPYHGRKKLIPLTPEKYRDISVPVRTVPCYRCTEYHLPTRYHGGNHLPYHLFIIEIPLPNIPLDKDGVCPFSLFTKSKTKAPQAATKSIPFAPEMY